MAKDLTVTLEDRPGTMADLGEALGNAGVNIEGICGFPVQGQGVVHVLVEDAAAARKALEEAGLKVEGERDAVVAPIENRPGQVGAICRKMAGAGVNIDLIYHAADGLVLGVDDTGKAQAAL
ncbi:MAG TPA: ACT domain-containing protein [Actinomycetota bacterium]|nr:ACT domain-containing protein [Actinomycetota bacterium]